MIVAVRLLAEAEPQAWAKTYLADGFSCRSRAMAENTVAIEIPACGGSTWVHSLEVTTRQDDEDWWAALWDEYNSCVSTRNKPLGSCVIPV